MALRLAGTAARGLRPVACRAMSSQGVPLEPMSNIPQGHSADAQNYSDVQTTTLPNGVVVVSQDSGAPVSAVSAFVAAGSRHENMASAGASSFVNHLAFGSTENQTALRIQREAENNTFRMSSNSDRQFIQYNSVFFRGEDDAVSIIADCVAEPAFHSWEVSDSKAIITRVAGGQSDAEGVVDDVYRAAFRNSFGETPSAQAPKIANVSPEDLHSFVRARYAGSNATVVGIDIDHDELVAAAQHFGTLPSGSGTASAPAKYTGGEARSTVYSASAKDSAAVSVLRSIIAGGNGSALKWSTDATASRVGAAMGRASSAPFSVRGFSDSYSDTGVAGFQATVASSDAGVSIRAAVEAAREVMGGSFSEADVDRAKHQVQAEILGGSRDARVAAVAAGVLNGGAATPEAAAAAVSAVTFDDVKAAAGARAGGKFSYAVRGNTDAAPFLDEM